MKAILTAALLLVSPARADVYDYGFHYANAAAAVSDGQALGIYTPGAPSPWFLDHVQPGMQCWRPSQDVTSTNPSPPPATLTTHSYLTGYYVLVSAPSAAPIPALAADADLAFILDRTAREAGNSFVVQNNIGAVLADLGCEPMFASPNPYPVGGFN